MLLALGRNFLKLDFFFLSAGVSAHSMPGLLLSLVSFRHLLCRLPLLGHRTTFLGSLFCFHPGPGIHHLSHALCAAPSPPACLCWVSERYYFVPTVLEPAVDWGPHERAAEVERAGDSRESGARMRTRPPVHTVDLSFPASATHLHFLRVCQPLESHNFCFL